MHANLRRLAISLAGALSLALLGCSSQVKPPDQPTPDPLAQSTEVVKSPNDQRDYRYLRLDNGLQVLLVSDPTTDKAAASLDVHVGHMSDPRDREGLAHFLEHMLFLGTEKYPEVGQYNEFIKQNGGRSNAGTGQEHTRYFFDIEHGSLEPALDRFAQFFIAPLLDAQYVEREKNAVNSEYKLKIKEEQRRENEVNKTTTNPEHPASQFSVGNLETLADRGDDKVVDDLMTFYKAHYSASKMALSILGREDLDTLEGYARTMFSAIPNNGSKAEPVTAPPFRDDQIGVRIDIKPLKEKRTLNLMFPVPSARKHFRKKPLEYISFFLGDEGKGSLYSMLKKKGWIEKLAAVSWGPDDHELMYISIDLTKSGLDAVDEITGAVFQYLRLLRAEGLAQSRFDELGKIARLNFRFKEKLPPMFEVGGLSTNLHYYPPAYLLNHQAAYEDFDAQLITEYLDMLTPDNLRQVVISPEAATDQMEARYSTPYGIKPIPADTKARWLAQPVAPELALPPPNPFIAENPSLKDLQGQDNVPKRVYEQPGFALWHHQDREFRVPKADIYVQIYSDLAGSSASNRAKNALYEALLSDSLEEFGYPAQIAGLNYRLFASGRGLGFVVSGYDEKQERLLTIINQRIRELQVDPERFAVRKKRLIRDWRNAKLDRPYSQIFRATRQLVTDRSHMPEVLADALEPVTQADLARYIADYHKAISMEVLIHGNLTAAEAEKLGANMYQQNLGQSQAATRPPMTVRTLKRGQRLTRELDIDHNDSVIAMGYQGQRDDVALAARYQMLAHLLGAPFFNELRTKQQLGYVAGVRFMPTDRLPGVIMFIQSPKVGPAELERRIDGFLKMFEKTLSDMAPEEFAKHKAGLENKLMEKETLLRWRSGRFWGELNRGDLSFDSREQLVAQVKTLTREQLLEFVRSDIVADGSTRMVVRSFGKAHRDQDYTATRNAANLCGAPSCFADVMGTVSRP